MVHCEQGTTHEYQKLAKLAVTLYRLFGLNTTTISGKPRNVLNNAMEHTRNMTYYSISYIIFAVIYDIFSETAGRLR